MSYCNTISYFDAFIHALICFKCFCVQVAAYCLVRPTITFTTTITSKGKHLDSRVVMLHFLTRKLQFVIFCKFNFFDTFPAYKCDYLYNDVFYILPQFAVVRFFHKFKMFCRYTAFFDHCCT